MKRYMSFINKKSSIANFIVAFVPIAIMAVVISSFFDYYYELNDDVLMKDILSGMYDGTPSGYNIQMQWPLSAFVALLYKICPCVPWYGLLLLIFQYGSLVIIADRLIKNIQNIGIKILTSLSVTILLASCMLIHFSVIQYTVTVSLMAGAAIGILAVADEKKNPKEFLISNIPTVIILFLGFMLRSEMMLLMMPFVCATAVFKWSLTQRESFKELFSKEKLGKYLSVFLVTTGLFMIVLAVNKLAYSSEEWSDFVDLFDARTELYDYQVPPSYEGNEDFYEEIGLSKEEAILFDNYNYGMSEKVDNELMWQVADYAGRLNSQSTSTTQKLMDKLKIYIYEFTHVWKAPGTDYPWNIVAILLYILYIAIIVLNKEYSAIWRAAVLFLGRSAIWLYMLMGERTPDRITHSLYFVEIVTLIFLIVMIPKQIRMLNVSVSLAWLVFGGVILIQSIPQVKYTEAVKDEANAPYIELYEYTSRHPDNFYLMDTYSSVAYSEKMFGPVATIDKSNINTLGGWAAFSPIERVKLSNHGISNMSDGLLKEKVYFCKKDNYDMTWLLNYYQAKGIDIDVNLKEAIASFEIYSVSTK